ncbi:hypothetical protein ACVW16_006961 [Bradyrhizobium sp. USDA 4474]
MPYYSFDLVVGEEFKNQGGIILEDIEVASDRAVQLASELSQVRPELQRTGCAVRGHRPRSQRGLSHATRSRSFLAAVGRASRIDGSNSSCATSGPAAIAELPPGR